LTSLAEPSSQTTSRSPVSSRFRVADSCCLECSADLAGALRELPGVADVQVHSTAGVVIVQHDGRARAEAVRRQAARVGVSLVGEEEDASAEQAPWWRQRRFLALALASLFVASGLVLDALTGYETAALVLYFLTIAVNGPLPLRSAWLALREHRLSISTLLVVAVAGAIALGRYEEAALLVVVFSLGGVLEEYVTGRARSSIRSLMALVPPVASRRHADGGLETVPVEDLLPGEIVVVRPGERLPTDGILISGRSGIDQSAISGESMPVEAAPGASVFGGTVNGLGALEIRVEKPYADTVLARIIRQVEEAQAAKGRGQRFADRFGAIYTPAMFMLAVMVASVPPLLGGDLRSWVYRSLVVLVVSCSCGLIMSVPVAVIAAVSRAARDGILIKGGLYLERLAAVRAVAFDKTGTLTFGQPRLIDVVSLDGMNEEELLRLAASIEAASEHPLAGAIVAGASERGLSTEQPESVRALPGIGVEGTLGGRSVFVGRPNGEPPQLARLEAEGKTAVVVREGDQVRGLLAVADELRPEAPAVATELHRLKIEHVLMLTGDNPRVAATIAAHVGIDDWRAGLLPEDKTAALEQLRRQHGPIAMVGDGVNDAPALATADVGIAMGAASSDVALETADVALMADDLNKLPQAIRLARHALANIHQNIALSLLVVAGLVPAALTGQLSLTEGLLLNEGSALLIIANGLRLLRRKEASLRERATRRPAVPSPASLD